MFYSPNVLFMGQVNPAGINFNNALVTQLTLIFEFPPFFVALSCWPSYDSLSTIKFQVLRHYTSFIARQQTLKTIISFLMDIVNGNEAINYRLCKQRSCVVRNPKARTRSEDKGGSPDFFLGAYNFQFENTKPEITSLRRYESLPISPINWKLSCRFARRVLPHRADVVTHC